MNGSRKEGSFSVRFSRTKEKVSKKFGKKGIGKTPLELALIIDQAKIN